MGNGGIHHKWTLAGNGDENVDTGKGSPRSLSEQLTHTRLTEIYATSGSTQLQEAYEKATEVKKLNNGLIAYLRKTKK